MRATNEDLQDDVEGGHENEGPANVQALRNDFASKRRIVDVQHYFEALQEIYVQHQNYAVDHRLQCNFSHLHVRKSIKNGLKTKIQVTCSRCPYVRWIDLVANIADALTINESVVAALMFAGMTYNNIQELFAGIDIPFMKTNPFQQIRESLLPEFEWAALKDQT